MIKRIAIITAVLFILASRAYAGGILSQYRIPLNKYAAEAEDYIAKGDYVRALEMYEKARVQYAEEGKEMGVLLCLERMGWYKRELGEYGEALRHLRDAHPIGVRRHGDAAEIDADLGDIYMLSGDTQKAREHYLLALDALKTFRFKTTYDSPPGKGDMFTIFRKSKAIIHSRYSLGILSYRAGESQEALKHLEGADELVRRIRKVANDAVYGAFFKLNDDMFDCIGYGQTIAGAVYGGLGELDKARRYLAQGKEAFEAGNRFFGLLTNEALRIVLELRSPDAPIDSAALGEYDRFLQEAGSFGATDIVWRTSYEIGLALKKEKRYSEARGYFARAIDTLELTRSRLTEHTLKEMFAASAQDVYSEMIDLLLAMDNAEEGFDYLERSRARAFLDILAGRSLKAKRSVDPALIEREKELDNEIDKTLNKFNTTIGPMRKAISGEYEKLLSERQKLLESIKEQSLEFAATTSVTTIPVRKLAARLGKDTALISYLLSDERIVIWVVKEDMTVSAVSVDVSLDKMAGLVADYRKALAGQDAGRISEFGEGLYGYLIAPVRDMLSGTDKLYIVPSKALHYLPFSSLRSAQGRYLIEDFAVTILPNASSIFFLDKEVTTDAEHILAFGNPERKEAGLTLEFADDEVRAISRNFPKSRILTGKDAAESVFKQEDVIGTGIIHIAAHGVYYVHDPFKSALLLAGDDQNDGNLETFEIYSLTMNPKLVVLSACQSGAGEVGGGDEVQSLSRAFLYAGAGGVLVSLWNVNDKATALLMEAFYKKLKSADKAQALRLAQIELQKNPAYSSPYYWAAFYLTAVSE